MVDKFYPVMIRSIGAMFIFFIFVQNMLSIISQTFNSKLNFVSGMYA